GILPPGVSTPTIEAEWKGVMTAFINAVSRTAAGPPVFFFDDFHHIERGGLSAQVIQFVIRYLPPGSRIFLSSRTRPAVKLARLRTQGEVLDLGDDDLRFTLDETAGYLKRHLGEGIDEDIIATVRERSEGWPVSLLLYQQTLKQDGYPGPDGLRKATDQYMADQIWSGVDDSTRAFFERSSLIEPIEPAITDRVLKCRDSLRTLRQASEQNQMVASLSGGDAFRYHALFRDFLRGRLLSEIGEDGVRVLLARYAREYERLGRAGRAIECYLQARDFAGAARVIEKHGNDAFDQGRSRTLTAWLKQIPAAVRRASPWLQFIDARIRYQRGDLTGALDITRKAEKGFRARAGGPDRRGLHAAAMLRTEIHMNMGEYRDSLSAARDALASARGPEQRLRAHIRVAVPRLLLGETRASLGEWQKARRLARGPMAHIRPSVDSAMLNPLYFMGEFDTVLDETGRALPELHAYSLVLDRFSYLFYRVLALFDTGHYAESLRTLEFAEETLAGQFKGFRRAFVCLRAQNMLFSGKEKSAEKLIRKLMEDRSPHKLMGPDCTWNYLGERKRHRGDLTTAIDVHGRALAIARAEGKHYSIASSLMHLGATRLLMGGRSRGKAEAELAEAQDIAAAGEYGYITAQVAWHRSRAALAKEDGGAALDLLAPCLEAAAAHRYDHLLLEEGRQAPALVGAAYEAGLERPYLDQIFARAGHWPAEALRPLAESPDPETRKAALAGLSASRSPRAAALVRRAARREEPEVREAAARALESTRRSAGSPREVLSRREYDVLRLVVRGLSNAEIAERLYITEPTVKTHIGRIFGKLGVTRRAQVIAFYHRHAAEEGE
ncbi:MAG: LuxR C-terminal-related transcriptional regulator, partial [Pseudomonadota bacterium]